MSAVAGTDVRWEFLKTYVLKSMKLKPDKWEKMRSIEDNEILINEFLEKADSEILIFYVNAGGQLMPEGQFVISSKNKIIYFIKKKKEPITPGKSAQLCLYGDLSYAPLDHLAGLVDQVSLYPTTHRTADWV